MLTSIVNHACRYFVYSWQGAIDLSRLYHNYDTYHLVTSHITDQLSNFVTIVTYQAHKMKTLLVSCSFSLILLYQLHLLTFPYSSSSNDHPTLINSPQAITLLEAINLHLLSQLKWGNMLAYCQELSVCIMSLSLVLTCLRYCQDSLVHILLNFSVLNL